MGVVGIEPTQHKHQIYSLAQLSNVGAPPFYARVEGIEPSSMVLETRSQPLNTRVYCVSLLGFEPRLFLLKPDRL